MKRRGLILTSALGILALAILCAFGKTLLEEWHIARLRSKDEETCKAAASALARMKCYRAIPHLLELHREGSTCFGEASEALARLAGPEAVPFLAKGLANADRDVASCAALQLHAIGEPARAAVPALAERLEHAREDVKVWAAWVLAHLEPDHPRLSSALVDCLRSRTDLVRNMAKQSLQVIGHRAVPLLLATLRAGEEEMRFRAAETLALFEVEETPPAVAVALRAALKDASALVRAQASYALLRLGAEEHEALRLLVEALKDPAARARETAAWLLRFVAWPQRPRWIDPRDVAREALPALVQALGDPVPYVRMYAAEAIGNLGEAGGPAAGDSPGP